MRRRFVVAAVFVTFVLGGSHSTIAQEQNNPEILRKELAETMSQLKAAQDRKNELANEYEKLKSQLVEMQKKLDDANRSVATNAEHSYQLRAQVAAWNAFVDRDPRLRARWEIFLESSLPELAGGDWMLEKPTPKSLFGLTTQPATQPVTQPATTSATTSTSAPATTNSSGK